MKKSKIFFLLALFPLLSQAQQAITLRTAIDSALKNNFDIRIARNSLEISGIYNNYGEAGALPSVALSGSGEGGVNDTYQKTSAGVETTRNNKSASSYNAGINAGMTLFNGFKVFATKERLNLLERQSRTFLNRQVQNTIAAVMLQYYDIIRQESYLQILQVSLDVAGKKLETVNQQRNVGLANESDVLQAGIDLNLARQSVKSQELAVSQAKTDLLQLLGVKQYFPFKVRDTIRVDSTLRLDSTLAALRENPEYLSQEQQVRINEQVVKEVGAQRYPSIHVSTGYNYSFSDNSASQVTINQVTGPSVGATLQIPVFNGFVVKNHLKAARYNVLNARLEQENVLNSLTAGALKTYQSYATTLDQLKDQQTNYGQSGKLLQLMLNRFQVNQATILDMKAAQESYEKAGYLLVNLQYVAKASEIELKLLTYSLGKSGDF